VTADVINLRRARKEREREARAAEAAANRLLHGRSKGEKRVTLLEAERLNRTVDGARLAPDGTRPGTSGHDD
jgi:hypothetical protein